MVNLNSENLKKMNFDPVTNFLSTINKLYFIANQNPVLKKDSRQVLVENFHRHLFGKNSNGNIIKAELIKLNNCSRENV